MSAEQQQQGAIDNEHLQLQMYEAQILRELASHERGEEHASKIPKTALEEDLKKMQFLIKVKEYVAAFPPEEQQGVIEKFAKEGFPPEFFTGENSFIIPGNQTVH